MLENRPQTKLEKLRQELDARISRSEEAQCESPGPDKVSGPCRRNALDMLRERCAWYQAEELRLRILIRVIESGMEEYGEGAIAAEEALHEILMNTHPNSRPCW